jgi:hypothetical protein
VVVVSGKVVPQFARGETFPWGVLVYDSSSDAVLDMTASLKGTWPAWFDALAGSAR